MRAFPYRVCLLLWVAALPSAARGGEVDLITDALFGRLNQTATFDVNQDAAVSAADLTAGVLQGEPSSPGCGASLPAGGRRTIQVGADLREYVIRLPADYDGVTPRPLVFGFHGFGGAALIQEQVTQLPANWPEAIGVYPEGLERAFPIASPPGPGWQIAPSELGDRDVSFFDAMLEQIAAEYCINPRRIYVSGHSNGAFFSHVLACERGDELAAAGAMSGGLLGCTTHSRVAVILSHGTADNVVVFQFGTVARAEWVTRNGCSNEVAPYAWGCEINPDCPNDWHVAFCVYPGTHTPDPAFPQNMFRFFKEHALPRNHG